MQQNEPFNPDVKSRMPSGKLKFRLAEARDRERVTGLMAERNPDQLEDKIMKNTDREIALTTSDPKYRLFVAELDGAVVGLCRYFHSEGLPPEKLQFPAPHGWYCMGILVDQKFRRQSIARFLFQQRLNSLRDQGAKVIYSMTAVDNPASMRMHKEFGFEKIEEAHGFLNIKFDCGCGALYRMSL